MKIVIAPDSFKGSLPARRLSEIISAQAKRVFAGCETVLLPMADGGEGTLEVLHGARGGRYVNATVNDPLFAPVSASYLLLEDGTAIIEMAAASGLPMVPKHLRDAGKTTTLGTGELILDALNRGCRSIVIGLGGSATNDGGVGALHALGVRFCNAAGEAVTPVGESLGAIARIDASGLPKAAREASFSIMSDVDNPLTGKNGATYTFGPQKGASEDALAQLEAGMLHYAALLHETFGFDADTPGSGAAGGLGAALMAALHARIESGIEAVMRITGFEQALEGASLVVTGEGRVDWQSAHGKVICGVGNMAAKHGVPAVAVTGGMGSGAEAVYACGIRSIMPTVNGVMTLETAIADAERLCADAAYRLFALIKTGGEIR